MKSSLKIIKITNDVWENDRHGLMSTIKSQALNLLFINYEKYFISACFIESTRCSINENNNADVWDKKLILKVEWYTTAI